MESNRTAYSSIKLALKRARIPILTIALAYFISVLAGAVMVHAGLAFALDARDRIVGRAYNGSDPTIDAMQKGRHLLAALSDFSQNLFLGAIPSTLSGLGVIIPYPLALYRGWIGGIVSVDGNHVSRLAKSGEAVYYIVTLLLQLIPYSLAGGAGVHLGLAYYRIHSRSQPARWYELPRPELLDVARIYLLVVPLFLIASLWEFLVR